MQKLLRRSSRPILRFQSPLSVPLSGDSLTSLDFSAGAMSSSAAALRYSHSARPPRNAVHARSVRAPSNFRSCGCSVGNGGNTAPYRAWAVSRESNYGSVGAACRTRYGTLAGGSDKFGGEMSAENEAGDDVEVVRAARVQRRRSGGEGGGAVVGNPDLLTIPGVGPRNLRKLVDKGFEGVAQLKKLYKDKFFGKSSQKMVEYLKSSVGIIHKRHAERITTFIKESVDEELEEGDVRVQQKQRITLCVEGNISVGKTTFLHRVANETLELRDLVEVVPEPVDKWQNVGENHFNILDAFYHEPERYAYTFQNYVFVTRLMQERESSGCIKPLRLMERSVFSDRMVFVRAVHEAKWMNEMEICLYDSWFDPVVSSMPGLIPDGFIYLRASPDTCHKRMMSRNRAEEGGVSLDYLHDLHEKHESWLFPAEGRNPQVLSVNKLTNDVDWSLHPNIRDRVFYLEGNRMHSSIQKVPALVLDCEPDVDFSRDIKAKQEYARQVAEFFKFVKKEKEVPPSNAGEVQERRNRRQVVLPHHRKLWLPGTQPFPDSAIKSLNLGQAMPR